MRLGFTCRCRHGQQFSGLGDIGSTVAIGEQTVVADAVKAFRQDVGEKAADELVRCKPHCPPAFSVVGAIVLVTKRHVMAVCRDEASVGDGDPVRVAREIVEDGLRPAEGPLGID